jgi:hypothetical protein
MSLYILSHTLYSSYMPAPTPLRNGIHPVLNNLVTFATQHAEDLKTVFFQPGLESP